MPDGPTEDALLRYVENLGDDALIKRVFLEYWTHFAEARNIQPGAKARQLRHLKRARDDLRAGRDVETAQGILRRFLFHEMLKRAPSA